MKTLWMAFLEHLKEDPGLNFFYSNKTEREDIVNRFLQKIYLLESLTFSLENLQGMGMFGNLWGTRDILNKAEEGNVNLDARDVGD